MKIALIIISCYLLGSIPFGYVVGKLFKKIDIREFGSGNIGTTNALRTLGLPLASFVAIGDKLPPVALSFCPDLQAAC